MREQLSNASPAWRLTLVLILTSVGVTHCAPGTWNDESRMATIQSLVESRTLSIDQSSFASTGDKVFVGGHFYSDKPPLPALLGAVAYAPLFALGLRLREGDTVAYFLVTLLTVGSTWLAGTLAFYHSLRFSGLDPERRLLPSIVFSLGTIYLSWSTAFNNHELAAGFLALGFLFWLKARFEGFPNRNLAITGFFLSLAGACDMPTAVFYVIFLVYVMADRTLRPAVGGYLGACLFTLGPTLLINYSIHQSIMPVQVYRSYFEYPGSPWHGSTDLSGMKANDPGFVARYALNTLIGPKGFLLYNPFLVVAIWGLAAAIKRRDRFWREAVCVAVGSAGVVIYYWLASSNYGGWSYSIRWFVPLIPMILFFSHSFFANLDRRRMAEFRVLLAVSVTIAFVGAMNPWSPVVYSDISFVANIKQFVEHLRHPRIRRGIIP